VKRKLTTTEKAERARRRRDFETVFFGGKMKRVRRSPMVEGMAANEFIARNADPVWLHQNEMWEDIPVARADDAVAADEEGRGSRVDQPGHRL
jgi:hypothetical protein